MRVLIVTLACLLFFTYQCFAGQDTVRCVSQASPSVVSKGSDSCVWAVQFSESQCVGDTTIFNSTGSDAKCTLSLIAVYGGMGEAVAVGLNETYSTVQGPAVVYINDCTNWSYPSYASSGVSITC
eukprot:TRINITY_DN2066_c0_g1_i4.p1 TRINITY_DN2066_c0_g1~~TRINITY_DN2066_c0_g1_i4.p1  ORF type:complete len:125 (-),score=17.74 TRINITY_DN2066_c0_g1_i4:50-424(-)